MTAFIVDGSMPSFDATAASIQLEFSSARQVHDGINQAVDALIEPAREASCGIRVTRTFPGQFLVAVDESVPFGETYEEIAA